MIRSYGAGKFSTIVDGYVHAVSLDGGGDECGDVETTNHYCMVRLGRDGTAAVMEEARREGDTLTLDEAKLLRRHYGAILEEDNYGFVAVRYFATKRALEKKWATIEAAVAASDDDGGSP